MPHDTAATLSFIGTFGSKPAATLHAPRRQHMGMAKAREARAFGIFGDARLQADRPHRLRGASGRSHRYGSSKRLPCPIGGTDRRTGRREPPAMTPTLPS